jgi:hypothetical protein
MIIDADCHISSHKMEICAKLTGIFFDLTRYILQMSIQERHEHT